MGAAWAGVARLPVFVHDGLQDRGKRGDANACGDENGVLGPENVARWGSKRSIHVHLQWERGGGGITCALSCIYELSRVRRVSMSNSSLACHLSDS